MTIMEHYWYDNNIDPNNSSNIKLYCKYCTQYKFNLEINKVHDFSIIRFNCIILSAIFK